MSKRVIKLALQTLLLVSCASAPGKTDHIPSYENNSRVEGASNTPLVTPEVEVENRQHSYRYVTTIQELISQSEIIVIGSVVKRSDGVINMARDVENVYEADKNLFGLGQIYEFHVTQYVKGEGDEYITILQVEGMFDATDIGGVANMSSADFERAQIQGDYIPYVVNQTYLLFLRQTSGFAEKYYVGTIHPWRFVITADQRAVPETLWDNVWSYFRPVPLDVMIKQIQNPEQPIIPIIDPAVDPPVQPAYPIPVRSPTETPARSYPVPEPSK